MVPICRASVTDSTNPYGRALFFLDKTGRKAIGEESWYRNRDCVGTRQRAFAYLARYLI